MDANEKFQGYKFRQMVKGVKKMQPEADDAGPFLRITLANGHRMKIALDGTEEKKVVSHLRKGVFVEGTFDSIMGWAPEGERFARTHTLLNADIHRVEKGQYAEADVEDGIEEIDWSTVEATVQKAYVAPGKEEAAAAPDMTALAAALVKPQS